MDKITGRLSMVPVIKGSFVGMQTLKGSITALPTITANISLVSHLFCVLHEMQDAELYDGETEISPQVDSSTVLNTSGKLLKGDIVVSQIPYYETSNDYGYTVIIGG